MSKNRAKITEALKQYFSTDVVFSATVKSVNEDTCTIDVQTAEGMDIYDVKIRAVKTEKYGFIIYPKKDTTVQLCRIGNENDFLMLNADEVEKIYIKIESMSLEMTKDGFVFNDGQNKGLVKLPQLVQKINDIENKVNQLVQWTATHTHPVPSLGTSGVAVGVTGNLTTTKESDLENEKIKQ